MQNYIYHYTSIPTLKLILENKTLRLNRLTNVDDMEEGIVDVFGNMAEYVFVSSWTRDRDENISLWNMYTGNMKGVRIGIDLNNVLLNKSNDNDILNIKDYDRILAFQIGNFFSDVEYRDIPSVNLFNENFSISRKEIAQLGLIKRRNWSFQKEARFILAGLPRYENPIHFMSLETSFFEYILHGAETDINYIDVELREHFWNNAEIMMGPAAGEHDIETVNELVEKHSPNSRINVVKSDLKIRTDRY